MVSLIQSVGYKAKGFRSAEDFLKSRQLLNTACLILDVRMPSMEGLRTTAPAGFWELPNSDHFPSLHMIVTMFISKRFKLVLRDFCANRSARNLCSKLCVPPWRINKTFNTKANQQSIN